MKTVAMVGWRGMVGSVLMDRMRKEGDFADQSTLFFSTSQAGQPGPDVGQGAKPLGDAFDIDALSSADIVITSQGGDYTSQVHPKLRESGWDGIWIDAASTLRMQDSAIIVLDPVNRNVIDTALEKGIKDFTGGNCTVSLMLMGLVGLFRENLVEWMTTMTYQSASGSGARNMIELVDQMQSIGACNSGQAALELEKCIADNMRSPEFPVANFGAPLAGSLIPWIDRCMDNGQTREEWKGENESNKILGTARRIPIDGQCVRVGAMRCHSQALTIKLTKDVALEEIESIIASGNEWVRVIGNNKEASTSELTPTAVSGKMHIPVGRIRKMTLGPEYLTCFTVGDQLLWGAAEPIRRMLRIALGKL